MLASKPTPHPVIVTHAVLTGLTPLIPLPVIDDLLYAYFMRSMVRQLANSRGKELNSEDVKALAAQPKGCGLGCIASVIIYPFKKVLRKILFFLEWKRATDIISRTYCEGYLLDESFAEGWLETYGAIRIRAAIDSVLIRTNTSPVRGAVYGVVKQSKGAMRSLTGLLQKLLGQAKRNTDDAKVAKAVAEVENDEMLGSLIDQLQGAMTNLPTEFLQNLKLELESELSRGGKM